MPPPPPLPSDPPPLPIGPPPKDLQPKAPPPPDPPPPADLSTYFPYPPPSVPATRVDFSVPPPSLPAAAPYSTYQYMVPNQPMASYYYSGYSYSSYPYAYDTATYTPQSTSYAPPNSNTYDGTYHKPITATAYKQPKTYEPSNNTYTGSYHDGNTAYKQPSTTYESSKNTYANSYHEVTKVYKQSPTYEQPAQTSYDGSYHEGTGYNWPPRLSYRPKFRETKYVPRPRGDAYKPRFYTETSRPRTEKSYRNSPPPRFRSSHHSCERRSHDIEGEKHASVQRRPSPSPSKPETERDRLLKNWRSNFCKTAEDISRKLAELAEIDVETWDAIWIRSSPSELFYRRADMSNEVVGTARSAALCKLVDEELVQRAERVRKTTLKQYEAPQRKLPKKVCKHKCEETSSDNTSDDDDNELKIEQDSCMEELTRKLQHPYRIHADLWHNDPGEMNDGPLCRCSAKSRRFGIRHGIYPGETVYTKCDPNSNNASKLHHYRITISPPTNFLTKTPTIIKHDEHEFLFEGFSLLSHYPIGELPTCKVIRFNIEYTILYDQEPMPQNFTIRELELFSKYLFHELLELVDFNLFPKAATSENSCPAFHFLPRFVRGLPDNGKEILAISEVLKYLLDSSAPLVDGERLLHLDDIDQRDWQDYVDLIKGMLVVKPGYKPCSVRVDQLDRIVTDLPECEDELTGVKYPAIVHFGIRPPQLSYAGNPEYQKAWREYVKFRHLLANMSKPSFKDKRKLEEKEARLQEMRTLGRMKRNITIAISSKGFWRTGIMCDVVQHAMLIPVLAGHLRFHKSLDLLEQNIAYKFKNRYLLQLALTHPSYKENYGTNPDHARNSLTNCGIRQPEYGDRKIHYMNSRKRGINTLISIMSLFGKEYETASNITHNERLEFLGDAVVEFLSSIHLFFLFPDLEEGGLATYRAALVQNQHLALLAKKLHLEDYMLYAHGSDLCHELELRHAMANCFEALMGALLLDGGINVADEVFMNALFMEDDHLREIWKNYPEHPLQEQEPMGDRACIATYKVLQNLTEFENTIGIQFKHIRLLARAFTDRSIGFTHLTLGSNQRLEFLGDTVLQLICSEYLYRHFPEHHEGHLSLLRSSLVNNRTQAVVCDDLGMTKYAVYANPKGDLKTKDRADLLEAFLGALYVDKGLMYCEQFCHVCIFPRLQMFIMNQDWNDPKSKLQQCCLTLRTMDGGEPDIPIYKVIESLGPTNTRIYTVAVYFRSKRLASATGPSIQQAEMNAAKQALENSHDLFPQLAHQKRVIAKSIQRHIGQLQPEYEQLLKENKPKPKPPMEDESHLPKQYRKRIDISSDELPDDDDDDDDSDANNNKNDDDNDDGGDGDDSVNEDSAAAATISQHKNTIQCGKRTNVSSSGGGGSSSSSEDDNNVTQSKGKKQKVHSKKTKKRLRISKPIEPANSNANANDIEDDDDDDSSRRFCEDVSSDECFEETFNTHQQRTQHSPKDAPKVTDEEMKEETTTTATTTATTTTSQEPLLLLTHLKDLVEDISSASDIESGELTN